MDGYTNVIIDIIAPWTTNYKLALIFTNGKLPSSAESFVSNSFIR